MASTKSGGKGAMVWLTLVSFFIQTINPATWGYPIPHGPFSQGQQSRGAPVWEKLLDFVIPKAHAQSSDPLLAGAPEFDLADPFLVEKADELGRDPMQIFAFVRDEIGFESYTGSLRGARGTLWSKAGNALDKSSLLIALLRISNVPARYVSGTLADDPARELILSMFQDRYRVLGCPPAGSTLVDPANDPELLSEARDHYWVQFDAGGGFQDADPTFSGAQIGESFTTPQGTLAETSPSLRHTVTFKLDAEMFSQASALFGLGSGISTKTVLTQTFTTAELVGRPITIGQFVNSNSLGFVLSATTHTYAPFLLVGGNAADPAADDIIRGEDFQEVFTNFPAGSTVLTGLFVHVSVTDGAGVTETRDKTLFDRIGFAARNNATGAQVSVNPGSDPSLTANDLTTFNVLSGQQDESMIMAWSAVNDSLSANLRAIIPQLPAPTATPTTDQATLQQQASLLSRDLMINTQRALTANFARADDVLSERFARNWYVKAFTNSPRLLVASSRVTDGGNETTAIQIGFDVLKGDIKVVLPPGQTSTAARAYRTNRGLLQSQAEGQLLSSFAASRAIDPNVTVSIPVSATDILQQSVSQGIGTTVLASFNLSQLDTLDISVEAKARVTEAVTAGRVVQVPNQAVPVNGIPRLGWLEVQVDGSVTGVLEDGSHGAIIEYAAVQVLQTALVLGERETILFFQGFFTGWIAGQLINLVGFYISGFKVSPTGQQFLSIATTNFLDTIVKALVAAVPDVFFRAGFYLGLQAAQFGFLAAGAIDPPLPNALFGGTEPLEPIPGTSPGVIVNIVSDPNFTVPIGGAQVPTVFRALIRNTGSEADIFALTLSNAPPGFILQSSLPSVRVPAGDEAEIGVCVIPSGALPAVGSNASLRLDVTSTTNASVTFGSTEDFLVPEIHGVTVTSDPPALSTTPGAPVETNLMLRASGNVPETVGLSSVLPNGLTLGGLTPVVNLAIGETATLPLVLAPSADTPLNSTLTATIHANFGAPEPQTLPIPVRVAAPGADAAGDAAVAARQLGDTDLANRLNDLEIALTTLVQTQCDEVSRSQVLANLDSIVGLIENDPTLSTFAASLDAARNALASAADAAQCLAQTTNLGATLEQLASFLTGLAAHGFEAFLLPTSQVAQPQTPANFELKLHNIGADPTIYDIALSGLPSGVDAQINPASLTLNRDDFGSVQISLTQTSTTELAAVDFEVLVTPREAVDLARAVPGALSVRNEFVSVVSVTPNPAFSDPGAPVNVSTRVLNAVNRVQQAQASFVVKDQNGQPVFTSAQTPLSLSVVTSLVNVDLGNFDTTGFALGNYSIEVSLSDALGQPIPGGMGRGTLLIGSPVTASLDLTPDTLPPGDGVTTASLQINSRLTSVPPLSLLGQAPIAGGATGVAVRNNLAYVCGGTGISIVDISNPAAPNVLSTFGTTSRGCLLSGDLLFAFQGLNPSFTLKIYSIANDPLNPQLLGTSATTNYNLAFDLKATASHALVAQFQYCYFLGSNDIFLQMGDLLSFALNLDNPLNPGSASPVLLDVLFNDNGDAVPASGDVPGCPANGGNNNVWQMAQADAQTVLLASTTATGTDTQSGMGRIFSVDISDPANLGVVSELLIPGTVQSIGIAIDGNRALVVGSTGGLNDFGDTILTGALVFVVLDISDPRNPQILGSQATNLPARTFWSSFAALGNGLFAYARGVPGSGEIPQPELILINAGDPANIVVGAPMLTPDNLIGPNGLQTTNGLLIASGNAAGLLIYQLEQLPTIPITASVQIPNNTGVSVGSFNVSPTQVLSGVGFDTLVWDLNFDSGMSSQTLNWQTTVNDLLAGESRPVTGDTLIDFTVQNQPGELMLPSLEVASEQILGLSPASQSVHPGESANYILSVKNPTAAAVTYDLAVLGLPAAWANLTPSVSIPANSSQDLALTINSDPFASVGDYGFVVTATSGGVTGSVSANLTLEGSPVLPPPPDATAHGVVVDIAPDQATAGQGTAAHYRVRVTNTGSATESFSLSASAPAGVAANFDQNMLTLSPGASNFREVGLSLMVPNGTAIGEQTFTVTAVSNTDASVNDTDQATIGIVASGVDVALSTASGLSVQAMAQAILQATQPAHFTLRVTNTGMVQETYDLSLAGPLALYATLSQNAVTLNPGQGQDVSIDIAPIDNALPGELSLVARATARSDSSVQDSDVITLPIPESRGLSVSFDPDHKTLATVPGSTSFVLQVRNTGNIEESYRATISGLSGPATATLDGLDGQPTQQIDTFILPALSTGAIVLDAQLQQIGTARVTVTVTSLGQDALTGADTATITAGTDEITPVPALSRWMFLALVLLFILTATHGFRRRRKHRNWFGDSG